MMREVRTYPHQTNEVCLLLILQKKKCFLSDLNGYSAGRATQSGITSAPASGASQSGTASGGIGRA